jgi:hypothetical protein
VKYLIEDTPTGFKLSLVLPERADRAGSVVVGRVYATMEVEGSHNQLATLYGFCEQYSRGRGETT